MSRFIRIPLLNVTRLCLNGGMYVANQCGVTMRVNTPVGMSLSTHLLFNVSGSVNEILLYDPAINFVQYDPHSADSGPCFRVIMLA